MDDKKRARLLKICKVLALVLAAAIIVGIFVQSFLY